MATMDKGWKTVPNAISAVRGLMAIFVALLTVQQQFAGALALFVFAAATDWVDGFIAKRFNQMSKIGKVLDTVVDKLLIFGSLFSLAAVLGSCQVWVAIAIVTFREAVVFLAKRSKLKATGVVESAAEAGRFSMVAQSVATVMLFLWAINPEAWQAAALAALWLGVGASLASGWAYGTCPQVCVA